MGEISEYLLGLRECLNKDQIIQFVRNSINFDKGGGETLNGAKAILLFTNSNQQSWLVKTNKRFYKILDDRRKPKPIFNFSAKKEKILDRSNQPKLNLNPYKKDFSKVIFSFRPDKEYLIDKKLFSNVEFDEVITNFLKD